MLQTLFLIPHWLFEGPLLIGWLVLGGLFFGYLFIRHGNSNEAWSFLPVFAIVAVAIHFVLPQLEITGINPADPTGQDIKLGLAIRGYGVFMLLAIGAGMGITMLRGREVGIVPDQVMTLGFWLMISGIAGARLFYVVQKSDQFFSSTKTTTQMILNMVDMTKGGLVVYGSLFGAMIAGVVFIKIHRLSVGRVADLIAPGMVLGLAIGRIGCLMNGCCYGGVCDAPLPAVTFPAGSAPYEQQLYNGRLLGIGAMPNANAQALAVKFVERESLADDAGIEPGDEIFIYPIEQRYLRFQKSNPQLSSDPRTDQVLAIESKMRGKIAIPTSKLPARTLRTHPTQIYSSINAGLLCLVLWFYWTIRRNDGEVFGLMLILYPIGRFLMELIRQDELGQFGTELTISQWVSLVTIVIGLTIFVWARWTSVPAQPDPVPA